MDTEVQHAQARTFILPGIPGHIIQRGNNRSACFYAEEDYHLYLDTLKEQALKFDCKVHAYVLMTNHVHLLITHEKKDSAALLMKHLGQRYVKYINRTYKRSGLYGKIGFAPALLKILIMYCHVIDI